MDFAKLAGAVSQFAPTLAGMLGGPLAGMAVTALEGAFGLPTGAGPDAITKIVQGGAMTPEIISAVRAADQDHVVKLKQLDIDLAALNAKHDETFASLDVQDRDSARQRQMSLKDRTPANLAYVMIIGFFLCSTALIVAMIALSDAVKNMPQGAWILIGTVEGYLAAEAKSASAYFFGDTQGSKTKTAALVDIAKMP